MSFLPQSFSRHPRGRGYVNLTNTFEGDTILSNPQTWIHVANSAVSNGAFNSFWTTPEGAVVMAVGVVDAAAYDASRVPMELDQIPAEFKPPKAKKGKGAE